MGYFSSYMGGSKPTKKLIAGRVAALIKCVREDVGVSGLIAGSIVLNSDFTVAFRGGIFERNSKLLAKVSPKVQLEKVLTDSEIQNRNTWLLTTDNDVDLLTYAVITEFEKQSSEFTRLESMFKPTGSYVFVGKSAQYIDAYRRHDKNEMERLLRQGGEIHYLMETYESMGEAKEKEREEKVAGTFVGGIVYSYELPIE